MIEQNSSFDDKFFGWDVVLFVVFIYGIPLTDSYFQGKWMEKLIECLKPYTDVVNMITATLTFIVAFIALRIACKTKMVAEKSNEISHRSLQVSLHQHTLPFLFVVIELKDRLFFNNIGKYGIGVELYDALKLKNYTSSLTTKIYDYARAMENIYPESCKESINFIKFLEDEGELEIDGNKITKSKYQKDLTEFELQIKDIEEQLGNTQNDMEKEKLHCLEEELIAEQNKVLQDFSKFCMRRLNSIIETIQKSVT